jgi:hypothetical protein
MAHAVTALADQARRARQTGKRPGYEAAARWLAARDAEDVLVLFETLANATPTTARYRLAEELAP